MFKMDENRKKEILDYLKRFSRDLGAVYENGKLGSLSLGEKELKYLNDNGEVRIVYLKDKKRVLLA